MAAFLRRIVEKSRSKSPRKRSPRAAARQSHHADHEFERWIATYDEEHAAPTTPRSAPPRRKVTPAIRTPISLYEDDGADEQCEVRSGSRRIQLASYRQFFALSVRTIA